MNRRHRMRNRRDNRATAQDRADWARERKALIGSLITQEGFEGALVLEHIRGSQYLIRLADGTQVYASHKKQKNSETAITKAGWQLWEERR